MIPETFALSDAERRNPLWLKLKDHFEKRLAELRGKNDGPLSHEETLMLRGKIQFLKEFVNLGNEPPPFDG